MWASAKSCPTLIDLVYFWSLSTPKTAILSSVWFIWFLRVSTKMREKLLRFKWFKHLNICDYVAFPLWSFGSVRYPIGSANSKQASVQQTLNSVMIILQCWEGRCLKNKTTNEHEQLCTHLTSTSPPTCITNEPSGCFTDQRKSNSFCLEERKGGK